MIVERAIPGGFARRATGESRWKREARSGAVATYAATVTAIPGRMTRGPNGSAAKSAPSVTIPATATRLSRKPAWPNIPGGWRPARRPRSRANCEDPKGVPPFER